MYKQFDLTGKQQEKVLFIANWLLKLKGFSPLNETLIKNFGHVILKSKTLMYLSFKNKIDGEVLMKYEKKKFCKFHFYQ